MLLRVFLSPLIPGMLIMGCSAPSSYPSLLPRPAESQNLEEPVAAAPAPNAPNPAVDAQIADAMRILEERTAAFDAASARAERLVAAARGAAAGSETWLDAHVALAELDTLRSATAEIAITLDALASERALSLAPASPRGTCRLDEKASQWLPLVGRQPGCSNSPCPPRSTSAANELWPICPASAAGALHLRISALTPGFRSPHRSPSPDLSHNCGAARCRGTHQRQRVLHLLKRIRAYGTPVTPITQHLQDAGSR